VWAAQFEVAERHLEQGVALARRIGRPFLEFSGLAHQAVIETYRSFAQAAERSRQAIELARRHGWTDEPTAGTAYVVLGAARLAEHNQNPPEPPLRQARHP
jgi:LuxR family transcriptional regulator, maltose regulon positive regulatory protein